MPEAYRPQKAPQLPARTESVRDEIKDILREKRAEEKELANLRKSGADPKLIREKEEAVWELERQIYGESATPKALKLRDMKIKDIFGCPFLVDKEVLLFKRWFKENYNCDVAQSQKDEIAEAIYSYTERNATPVQLAEGKAGPGFQIVPWKEETEEKTHGFFASPNSSLRTLLEKRQGQCVALTTLYCALAEELGVKARPVHVREYENGKSAERGEDTGHFAPVVFHGDNKIIFDPVNNIPYAKHRGIILEKEFLLIGSLTDQAIALRKEGNYGEAIALYDKALELNPNYITALADKGTALCSLGKYDEAIACYGKALEINPDYVVALAGKGFALISMEKYEDALMPIERALELNPGHFKSLANKGIALMELESYEGARDAFESALFITDDPAIRSYYELVLNAIKNQEGMPAESTPA